MYKVKGVVDEVERKILRRLQEWEQGEGQLPCFIQHYRELLQIQSEAKSRIIAVTPGFTRALVSDRLRAGVPLLSFEDFCPDWDQVQALFAEVVAWVAKDSQDPSGESERLGHIGRDHSLLMKVARAWYVNHFLTDLAAAQSIGEELLASVMAAVLKPFLSAYSRLLLPEVDQGLWRRKYCPICGGKPDLAYLDKERGARWLVCCRCDTEWLFQRLECPYCGSQDHNATAYFTDDEASYLYRLYVCEQCHTYIKTIDLRRAPSEVLLPLERMLTLAMDRRGQEIGYRAGWHK